MSLQEHYQPKRQTPAEVNNASELQAQQHPISTHVTNAYISKEYQDRVFSIPELQSFISAYLTGKDLKSLMLTCQAWFDFYAPLVYKRLWLSNHPAVNNLRIHKFGIHAQELKLYETDVQIALHAVENTPHLRRLELSRTKLTSSELDLVLSVVSGELSSLKVQAESITGPQDPWAYEPHYAPEPWFPEPLFHCVAHLRNLQSLQWAARGMTIHVDDILRVLQACPRLVSLSLGVINVIYVGHDSTIPLNEQDRRPIDRPGPLVPIPDADLDTLYSGHQLKELELDGTVITDEGLLRLLGIDIQPVHNASHRSPALIQLVVNSIGPTYRSGARILQECSQLEVIQIAQSRIASVELFQGEAVWPCAPFIKELCLDVRPLYMHSNWYHNYHHALRFVEVFSATEQQQVWNHLQSMGSLRKLRISGYPIDLRAVDDMSFAKQLESGSINVIVRVPSEQIEDERERIVAVADEWVSRNPQGWSYHFDDGHRWNVPKLEMTYNKE